MTELQITLLNYRTGSILLPHLEQYMTSYIIELVIGSTATITFV